MRCRPLTCVLVWRVATLCWTGLFLHSLYPPPQRHHCPRLPPGSLAPPNSQLVLYVSVTTPPAEQRRQNINATLSCFESRTHCAFTESQYLTGSASGGSAASAILLPGVRRSICGPTRVRRAHWCKPALTWSVDFSCWSTSCPTWSSWVGTDFYRVLSDEVIVHLWFDINNSLWGERLHEGLNSGGKARGSLLYRPPPDKKQKYISVHYSCNVAFCLRHWYVKEGKTLW